jgi:hypothetical protein
MDTQAVLLAGEAAAAAAAVVVAAKSTLPTFVYSGLNFYHGMLSTNRRLASIYCRLAGSQGSLPASRQVIAVSFRDKFPIHLIVTNSSLQPESAE